MHPSEIYERSLIPGAAYFVVFRARGRGANVKEQYGTLAEAVAAAAGDRRAIVYAVMPTGQSIMVPEGYEPDRAN